VTASIPLSVPLVVAILGLIGTAGGGIAGVMITQRRSDARELAAWERERLREHERWTREDTTRTFEQRREAYSDFYELVREMERTVYDYGMGLPGSSEASSLPFNWNLATFRKLQHLQLYASGAVWHAAASAYNTCWHWGNVTVRGQDDAEFYGLREEAERYVDELLSAIRSDLAIEGDWASEIEPLH
jgi:hypothetical protein